MRYTVEENRQAKGISIVEMAEYLGVSPTTYRTKELSPGKFKLDEVIKVSAKLEVPCEDIIFLPNLSLKTSI